MSTLKQYVTSALSIGLTSELSEGKKFALRVSVFDAYWTLCAVSFYAIYSFQNNIFPLAYYHVGAILLILLGLLLMRIRFFDSARILMHLTGLAEVFLATDAVGPRSGYEFYYFIQVLVPHITWSLDEKWWKGACLSVFACFVLVFQEVIGTGHLSKILDVPPEDRFIAIAFVISYTITVLIVARWKLTLTQRRISEQQNDLIHSNSLMALGEMAGGIAHEINNPLQNLSLQLRVVEDKLRDGQVDETCRNLSIMNETISKMGKMVQGLKDLSRKDDSSREDFKVQGIIEDVLAISSEKLERFNINLNISGNQGVMVRGNAIQFSQVLLNLLNNSIDALMSHDTKWISIHSRSEGNFIHIEIVDSGSGIPESIASSMMKPFYTTKLPSKGTGLGLSISQSIVEKYGGRLLYDPKCQNTKFIMVLPIAS